MHIITSIGIRAHVRSSYENLGHSISNATRVESTASGGFKLCSDDANKCLFLPAEMLMINYGRH